MEIATGVVDTCDGEHTVNAGVVDTRNNERAVSVVVGVIVTPVLCRLADVRVGVVDVEVTPHCVAAVDNVADKAPFTLTIFSSPTPP